MGWREKSLDTKSLLRRRYKLQLHTVGRQLRQPGIEMCNLVPATLLKDFKSCVIYIRDNSFSTLAKFSEKVTFLPPNTHM